MVTASIIQSPSWLEKVIIRPLREGDLPALEWDGEYKHFRRMYADIYQSSRKGRSVLWVAELEGSGIIGQIFVQLASARQELADGVEHAYIFSFRIKPAYRGYGIGTSMLRVVEADLARRKFRRVTLNVGQDNLDARRLYESLGYQVRGYDPGKWNYLDDQGVQREVHEPAWQMEKRVGNGKTC
jgi:ribosomal protein S18 acetylase RimI-like enzyme